MRTLVFQDGITGTMATLTIDADDLIPALVLALQDPAVRAALGVHQAAPITPRYLDDAAYAARLDVTARCVRKWRAKGMPFFKVGSIVRVNVAAADAWLESGGNVGAAVRRTLRALPGGR